MCIIANKIESVSKTKIFVATNPTKTKQITIYSNFVNSVVNNNAMILPIPCSKNVDFIDLSNYKHIFTDCQQSFYDPTNISTCKSKSVSMQNNTKLEIFNIGSYQVSLALNFEQLLNVNEDLCELTEDLKKMLRKSYSESQWGFIICKLKKGSENYHPFAYSHNIVDNKLFIPTKHFHVKLHEITFQEYWKTFDLLKTWLYSNIWTNYEIADDWEHDIYVLNFDINKNQYITSFNSCKEIWLCESIAHFQNIELNENIIKNWLNQARRNVQFSKINFDFDECKLFTKIVINGSHPNIDIIFAL